MARKKREDYQIHTGHSSLYDRWAKERRTHQVRSSRYRSTIIGTATVCTVIMLALWGGSALIRNSLSANQGTPLPALTPTPAPTVIPTPSPKPPVKLSQPLKDAIEKNEDVVGWIRIEATVINYPIVQGEDNAFYAEHGYDKQASDAGAIFMDVRCDAEGVEAQRHYILYGKHLEDGSRFSSLGSYLEEDFLRTHPIITLELRSGSYQYEVFSSYIVSEEDDYTQVDFSREPLWLSFIKERQDKGAHSSDIQLNSKDVVLTLSTYLSPAEKSKIAIHARFIK